MKHTAFREYPLSAEILKSLALLGYEQPTEVQARTVEDILEGKDVIIKSQTGSGKTAAFAIPICEEIDWEDNDPQALVITPTRELAMQVKEEVFHIGRFKKIKVCAAFGKASFDRQARELKQKMHVVVGTPGRLMDHIAQETLTTSNIKYLVIDEADELLNMGFVDQIHEIIEALPTERVTLVLSATMPAEIKKICDDYMKEPDFIEVFSESSVHDRIEQFQFAVEEKEKFDLLRNLTITENPDTCMVFCNTRVMVDDVYDGLRRLGYPCTRIHGGMEQRDRMREMARFKKGNVRYLIATGVAARGIDVEKVSLVVNYDIPEDPESYVHRIGRTGRKGSEGRAITFVTKRENQYVTAIEKLIGKPLTLGSVPSNEQVQEATEAFEEKLRTKPTVKEAKGAKLNEDILKIHINAGKKQKMRAADIVGTLCNIDGMTKADIGVINILDISTYVEVLHGKGPSVLNALQNKTLKGRIRKVSKADDEQVTDRRRRR